MRWNNEAFGKYQGCQCSALTDEDNLLQLGAYKAEMKNVMLKSVSEVLE